MWLGALRLGLQRQESQAGEDQQKQFEHFKKGYKLDVKCKINMQKSVETTLRQTKKSKIIIRMQINQLNKGIIEVFRLVGSQMGQSTEHVWMKQQLIPNNYNYMKTQRCNSAGKFCIQRVFSRGPLHLRHSRKVSQLQSKVHFFEGQVDPLHFENSELKDQLILFSKMVSTSTEILRNLLPIRESSRKLKLQLATIVEISDMIKHDWLKMEQKLSQNAELITQLQAELQEERVRFEEENALRKRQTAALENSKAQLKTAFEEKIKHLRQQIQELNKLQEVEKENMKADFQRKMKMFEYGVKEFQKFKYQTGLKCQEYEKCIERLNGEIAANLVSYEQNKKNLKQIYDKIMTDKLAEQAEGYDLLLKIKEQEKVKMLITIGEVQQENKRKLAQKELQISKLNEISMFFKEEIGGLKDQLWKKSIDYDKKLIQEKQLQQQIQSLNVANKTLLTRIQSQGQQFQKEKLDMDLKFRKQQKEMQLIKKDGAKALASLSEQKQKLQTSLDETTAKYKQTMASLAKSEGQFNSRLTKLKEEWEQQEQNLQKTIKDYQFDVQQKKQALQFSRNLNEQLTKEHKDTLLKINDAFEKKEAEMISKHESKLQSLSLQSQQKLQDLQRQHDFAMRQATIAANEELRQAIIENNKKLSFQAERHQQILNEQTNKHQAELQKERQQAQAMAAKLRQFQKELNRLEEEKQNIQVAFRDKMRKLSEQSELQKLKLNQEMQNQLRQFQKQLQEKEEALSAMRADMEQQIKMLKEANSMQILQNKYKAQIFRLKQQFKDSYEQLQSSYSTKYDQMQANTIQRIEQTEEEYQRSFNELRQTFDKDMYLIANQTKKSQHLLEKRLFQDEEEEEFGSKSFEEKKQYIIQKIDNLKKQNFQHQTKIVALKEELVTFEAQIQARVKAKKQQLQHEKAKLIFDCQKTVDKITSECKARVDLVQKDRIQHTQILKGQFELMQLTHQKQMRALKQKYLQLETLFEERPSRAEDLTKIKQLINIQSKMDMQMQTYHKKMQTANQIVKYLNLQLQNYKDAYDMFGPNSQNKEIGIIGQKVLKQPQLSNSPSHTGSEHFIEPTKGWKPGLKQNQSKKTWDVHTLEKEPLSFRKWNDTPGVKQLKLFEESQEEFILEPQHRPEAGSSWKLPKYSNLIHQKRQEKRERYRTEKSQKQPDNEAQMFINAEHFLRILKGEPQNPVIKQQSQSLRRKNYRKRKVTKKSPGLGLSQGL